MITDILQSSLKAKKGAVKGILEEFVIKNKDDQLKLIIKLDNIINIELSNKQTQNQIQNI